MPPNKVPISVETCLNLSLLSTLRNPVGLAILCLDEWTRAQQRDFMSTPRILIPGHGAERWTKPVRDTIKIYVDASVF